MFNCESALQVSEEHLIMGMSFVTQCCCDKEASAGRSLLVRTRSTLTVPQAPIACTVRKRKPGMGEALQERLSFWTSATTMHARSQKDACACRGSHLTALQSLAHPPTQLENACSFFRPAGGRQSQAWRRSQPTGWSVLFATAGGPVSYLWVPICSPADH